MATYAADNLIVTRTFGNPITPGAHIVEAMYFADDDTIANYATAIAGAAHAVATLTVGSLLKIYTTDSGNEGVALYLVSANNGSALTLVAGTALSASAVPFIYGPMDLPLTDGTYQIGVPGIAGTITAITSVLRAGAVTTNNAVCTFKINTTDITDGAVTVTASGSAAGDVDSAAPSAANVIDANDYIACVVSGTPGGSRVAGVSFLIDPA